MRLLENQKLPSEDIAASFENIVAEVLVERSLRCALDQGLNSLVLVGGVAANKRLRRMMSKAATKNRIDICMAPQPFCTDNAAMIGTAALMRLESQVSSSSLQLGISPRWPLEKADLLYGSTAPF